MLFLQGRGEPGDEVVAANLDRFNVAITGARWLVEEAARHGCHAVHVRIAHRELFFPGPRAEPAALYDDLPTPMEGTRMAWMRWISDPSAHRLGIALFSCSAGMPGERLGRPAPGAFLPEFSGTGQDGG